MKITTQPAGERQLSITIEVEEERVKRARRRAAREISREVDIPGFRKGKAPYDVVVQRLGLEVVRQELVATLAEDVYREALEQEEITPYALGALEETSFDPLTLTFSVPLVPEVDLGDYKAYRLEPPTVEVPTEMLDSALDAIREENAVLVPLDRPASEGDILVMDLIGRTGDGTAFLHDEDAQLLLDPERDVGLPGLVDALIGLEAETDTTFSLVLPEDFEVEELAGEKVEFEVNVEAVYERILPDLDDDLARTVGNYETLEDLKNSLRGRLEEKKRAQAESNYAEEILKAIIERAKVSYPSTMVEEGLDDAVDSYEREIERREHMMLEDYLRIQGKTMEQLREELTPQVKESIERSLVLGEVVEQEALEVSDEALDVQIAESSELYGEKADEVRAALSEPAGRRNVRNRMLANQAIDRLVSIAKGEHVESSAPVQEETDEEEQEEETNEA